MEMTLITDFYGAFLTKVPSNPYKSGFDLILLADCFEEFNINLNIKKFSDFQFFEDYSNRLIIYTSIEDPNGIYRSYMDDILFGLEQAGAILIPGYKFFKAHENKVFMEILRNLIFKEGDGITTYKLGSYYDFINFPEKFSYPVIIKKSSGSASKGVYLSKSKRTLFNIIRKITNTHDYRSLLIDFLFAQKKRMEGIKYINRYTPFRKKFIIQNFIKGLTNDFKVLIFDNKYYVLKRLNRSNDFRASGSGNFVSSDDFIVSKELLDSCEQWFKAFNVPCASFDVAYKDNKYYLLEFQFVNFGTYTQTSAKSYHFKNQNGWLKRSDLIPLEKIYVECIVKYLMRNSMYNS